MPAPAKDPTKQTGNSGRLVATLVVMLALFGVAAFASTKPSAQTPPQVAGVQTVEEYVPPIETIPANTPATDTNDSYYSVTSVIDGDTIKVEIGNKTETVRLIGVDTPETKDPRKPIQCFGRQASDFTKQQLSGTTVRLEPDSSQQDRDKYGRLLRYVYTKNGTLFNELLIESGYAYEYTYQNNPYRLRDDFLNAQRTAKIQNLGLWSPKTCNGKK